MDVGVLESHVAFYFLCIFIVEAKDEHGETVAAGEVNGFEQLATDAGQTEIDEVAV